MEAVRYDLEINKRSQFYKEIDLTDGNGVAIPLTGLTIIVTIRESLETLTNLYQLTVGNGGVTILDSLNGKIALYISSTDTDIVPSNGVYDLIQQTIAYPPLDNVKIMYGKVNFNKGLS